MMTHTEFNSDLEEMIDQRADEHVNAFSRFTTDTSSLQNACRLICGALGSKNKVLIIGNGGSAADAQHFAAELVGNFERDRPALPAMALTSDTSVLTAASNDFGFEQVFVRQIEAQAVSGDVLVCISTSGVSPNVINAAACARKMGLRVISLLGCRGVQLETMSDCAIFSNSTSTAVTQELHIFAIHCICSSVDRLYLDTKKQPTSTETRKDNL